MWSCSSPLPETTRRPTAIPSSGSPTSPNYLRSPDAVSAGLGGTARQVDIRMRCPEVARARRLLLLLDRCDAASTPRASGRPNAFPVTIKLCPSMGKMGDKHGNQRTALEKPETGVDLVLVFNLGSSSLKGRADRCRRRHSSGQAELPASNPGKEVDGPLGLAWMPGCRGGLAPWLERIVWPPTGWCMRRTVHDPDLRLNHTGGGRGAQAPSYPLAPLHNAGALAAIRWLRQWRSRPCPVACFEPGFTAPWKPAAFTYAVPDPGAGRGLRRLRFPWPQPQHIQRGGDGPARPNHHPSGLRLISCHLAPAAALARSANGRMHRHHDGLPPLLEGLVMASRQRLVDPGLLLHQLARRAWTVEELGGSCRKGRVGCGASRSQR